MLRKLLARRDYGILRYNSTWQNIAALFYLALTERLFTLGFLEQVGLFILFSTMMTGYGYLVNDLADLELDRRHGKSNAFARTTRGRAALIVMVVLLVGGLFAFPFLSRPLFLASWGLWILAATFYSMPPLRFKERGLTGLVAAVAGQQTLPAAILYSAFGNPVSWGGLVFIMFATVRGVSSDVGHQIRDRLHDFSTGTGTFAVRTDPVRAKRVYAASLEMERISFGVVLALLLADLPRADLRWFGKPASIAWPLVLIYLVLFVLTVGRSWRALRRNQFEADDPYDEERQKRKKDALHIIHHTLPSVATPIYLALWMTYYYWPNLIFLVVLVGLYGVFTAGQWAAAKFRGLAES